MLFFFSLPPSPLPANTGRVGTVLQLGFPGLTRVISVDFLQIANMCFAGLITAAGEPATASGSSTARRCSDHRERVENFCLLFQKPYAYTYFEIVGPRVSCLRLRNTISLLPGASIEPLIHFDI